MAKHFRTCLECGERRFTRPVRFFPMTCDYVTADMCLWCRVGWRDSEWAELYTTLQHHRLPQAREAARTAKEFW